MSFYPKKERDGNNTTGSRRGWVDRNNHYERYYCEICNVWLGSDKVSIATHRNGKKHIDTAKEVQAKKLITSNVQEKQQLALQASMKQMETAAQASLQQDYGLFAIGTGTSPVGISSNTNYITTPYPNTLPMVASHIQSMNQLPTPTVKQSTTDMQQHQPNNNVKQERKLWDDRKKQRDGEKKKDHNDNNNNDNNDGSVQSRKRKRVKIGENEGYYSTSENIIWLLGVVFGEILEEDMPIQIWLGNKIATDNELQLPENQRHWTDGIIVATRIRHAAEHHDDRMVVDVSYLQNVDDTEEQLKTLVSLRHIRILLGNDADDRIPTTLEEARILAMGGEDVQPSYTESFVPEIDETTGLSGWSTIHVNRTTIRNELRTERELIRKQRKEAAMKAEMVEKEIEARRMEEAKVSNAEDSALGAYDIWGRTKDGYKGVIIHNNTNTELMINGTSVHDYGKELAVDGVTTTFKNKSKSIAKKRQNRRTTSADDD
jgi:U1 zinc finger